MGKNTNGEKTKFDLITASKTKKYKIISAVVLVIGVLMLVGGILLRLTVTKAVYPVKLGYDMPSCVDGTCKITKDIAFQVSTSTDKDKALSVPIVFELDEDAARFVEIRDKEDCETVTESYWQGLFYLHVLDNAPAMVKDGENEDVRPSGTLTISCGNREPIVINLVYYHED